MAHSPLFRRLVRLLHDANRAELRAQGRRAPIAGAGSGTWSRREFVASAAAAGAACSVLPGSAAAWADSKPPRIAIIGAGIAGLRAAYELEKHGHTATIWEARARTGGRMLTIEQDGLFLDLGGHLVNRDHKDMRALAKELGVPLFDRAAELAKPSQLPEAAYFFDGRRFSEVALARRLRPIARQISKDAARLDDDYDAVATELDSLSVADYLDLHAKKLRRPARALIKASIRSEYGVEPEDSSALQLIFNLPTVDGGTVDLASASDESLLVEGGSARITDALAARIESPIRTGKRLRRIDRTAAGAYQLEFLGRNARAVSDEADFVIVAIPFPPLRRVRMAAELPDEFKAFVRQAGLGRNEKVLTRFGDRVWRQAKGFSGEVWSDLGFSVAWDATVRQTARTDGALTFYLGGDEVDAASVGPANDVSEAFVAQLSKVVPGAQGAAEADAVRTRWTSERFTGGGYASFAPGQLTRFEDYFWIESSNPQRRQEVVFDRLIFVGEHLSDSFSGFMNGGAETGRLGAEALVRML